MTKAGLALVMAASLGLAACQGGDDITPSELPATAAAAAQENFLTRVPQAALDNAQRNRLAAIRGRAGEVHLARVVAAPGRLLSRGNALTFDVAPELRVTAVGEDVRSRAANDVSWAGPLQGAPGWVQMVVMDGDVTATVTVGETRYSVEPLGGGLHAVSKLEESLLPPEHSPENPSGALTTDIGRALNEAIGGVQAARAPSSGGTGGIQAVSTINVMVVYTASAASAAGNIASRIQLAVDETNQGYANSGINISMNRVHTAQVTYSESGRSFSTHVSNLRGTTDGQMDNVHTLRNTYGADVVVLVVNDSEACGIASAIGATASSAFAVAHYTCITGYYSFGHEIGHLQGARHDRYVDGSTSPYAYGHGFIPSSKGWRTVMAYGNNCGNCTRINYWSNPLKTYGGVAMGTAAYEDNARVLNLTAPTVALFR